MMRPLLDLASDGAEHTFRQAVEYIAQKYQLTPDDRAQRLSGGAPILDNRAGWARTYLVKTGLLESPRRGAFRITDRGRAALAGGEVINNRTEWLSRRASPHVPRAATDTALARWREREQRDVMDFLREENRVLKTQMRVHPCAADGRRAATARSTRTSDQPSGALCDPWPLATNARG